MGVYKVHQSSINLLAGYVVIIDINFTYRYLEKGRTAYLKRPPSHVSRHYKPRSLRCRCQPIDLKKKIKLFCFLFYSCFTFRDNQLFARIVFEQKDGLTMKAVCFVLVISTLTAAVPTWPFNLERFNQR